MRKLGLLVLGVICGFILPLITNAGTGGITVKESTLLPGQEFNQTIKRLAGQTDATYSTNNITINQILYTGNIPGRVTTVGLSITGSDYPVYGWFTGGIIYYVTEAEKIYLNPDSSAMFYYMNGLIGIDLSNWDTSKVTNMGNMFNGCSNLSELDLSGWDTSKVNNMGNMFNGCSNLSELDLSGWDTSNATSMGSMFYGCKKLTNLDVSKFDTSKVNNMGNMFNGCSNLSELDLSGWDTSNATSMGSMFYGCKKLTNLDVSKFDTSKVTNITSMFGYCSSLKSLDVSNFDTSNVTDMAGTFQSCSSLTSLDLSNWDTSNVTSMGDYMFGGMFHNCSNLISLDLSSWDTSSLKSTNYMFNNCINLETIYVSTGFVTTQVIYSPNMFSNDSKLVGGNGTKYNSSKIDKTYARIDTPEISGYFHGVHLVKFNSNGGTSVPKQKFSYGSSYQVNEPLPQPEKENYHFKGRYTINDEEWDFDKNITGDITLHAKWEINQYTITYELDNGVNSPNNVTGYTIETPTITLENPTKDGYSFEGWFTDTQFTTGVTTIPTGTTGDITLYAKWTPVEYAITYELDGGTNSENNTGKYTIETPDITLENPTKDGYDFDGWFTDTQFTTGVTTIPTGTTGDITLYAKWTKIETKPSGGSSGGGGGSSKTSSDEKDVTNNPSVTDDSPRLAGQDSLESGAQGDSDDGSSLSRGDTALAERGSTQTYTQEFQQAYEFAKGKGITTMPTIQKADMDGKLTRIAMAKMLSQYAMNVLGQKPENIITPKFNDVTDKMNTDYDDGVTLAYQLGIMGQNMPNNNFRPNDEVTRAEFATALSRMIYHTSDGEYKSTPKYYIHHMEKLVKEGIITKDDPKMKELRGYVMIMLMRSAK